MPRGAWLRWEGWRSNGRLPGVCPWHSSGRLVDTSAPVQRSMRSTSVSVALRHQRAQHGCFVQLSIRFPRRFLRRREIMDEISHMIHTDHSYQNRWVAMRYATCPRRSSAPSSLHAFRCRGIVRSTCPRPCSPSAGAPPCCRRPGRRWPIALHEGSCCVADRVCGSSRHGPLMYLIRLCFFLPNKVPCRGPWSASRSLPPSKCLAHLYVLVYVGLIASGHGRDLGQPWL